MMKYFLLIVVFSVSISSCSRKSTYEVEKIIENNPISNEEYTFPILKGNNKVITNKINSHLAKNELDINISKYENSIFENVWETKKRPTPTRNYLTYKHLFPKKHIYSVRVKGEFCLAYCEDFENTYNYDLENGELVDLYSLLSLRGQLTLIDTLKKYKKSNIELKLNQIKKSLSNTKNKEELDFLNEQLDLYQNCSSNVYDLDNYEFVIKQDSIIINLDRCSAHYNRAYDELWEIKKGISINDWKAFFSEYGKRILLI